MGGGGSDVAQMPVFDLEPFLEKCILKGEEPDEALKKQCEELAQCLKDTSALVVKDPRCPSNDNNQFLDMIESYFAQEGRSIGSRSTAVCLCIFTDDDDDLLLVLDVFSS
mmetsp:Transcript_8244/g.23569  ORF Transcript_8244/g.23569 Transcript_8244/m.23569 type:complete len:110 (-) Transcript_8244:961-1290(-)